MDTDIWNDSAIWNVLSATVATDMERQHPRSIPCKVRIKHKLRHFEVLAFVGRGSDAVCRDFVSELEARGYLVLGYGMSETESNWGVIVEPLGDDDWADCVAFEALELELAGRSFDASVVSLHVERGRSVPCR